MIIDWLKGFNPITQALFATLFTWGITALGASLVFLFKDISKKVLNGMLGFAVGVMIAASYWSLLAPAIEMAKQSITPAWIPVAAGFLSGGAFLYGIDKILPHLRLSQPVEQAEGIKTSWQRSILLVLAITLHNIPEGLAVGVAFGAVASNLPSASLVGAVALAIGIGIKNFPEGAAVSIPLRREGFSRLKSFLYGQASGIVEPIAGVIGAYAAIAMGSILPYALSFAAGALIFVVVEELIPESQQDSNTSNTDIATIGAMIGFVLMMILDIVLG